jgi:Flp pilus assembly protein CpaB
MIGQVSSGDRVDIYAGFNVYPIDKLGRPISGGQTRPVLRLIMQDVTVLGVTKSSAFGGGTTSQVTLRTTGTEAENLAFASDNGKVWVVLRPPTGAKPSAPTPTTVETLMFGVSPVTAIRSFEVNR